MKRETAYKLAIEALIEKRRREYGFDYNIGRMYPSTYNESATRKFLRIAEAIGILEGERDHQQMALFGEVVDAGR